MAGQDGRQRGEADGAGGVDAERHLLGNSPEAMQAKHGGCAPFTPDWSRAWRAREGDEAARALVPAQRTGQAERAHDPEGGILEDSTHPESLAGLESRQETARGLGER